MEKDDKTHIFLVFSHFQKGPVLDTVYTRELIVKYPSPADIIKESGAYCKKVNERNFTGQVLGYVTPVSA